MSKSFEDIYRGLNYDLKNHYIQGIIDAQNNMLRLVEEEIARVSNPMMVDQEYIDGLQEVISIIKGEIDEQHSRNSD